MSDEERAMRLNNSRSRLSAFIADAAQPVPYGGRLSGPAVVQLAKEQLTQLTGFKADTVSQMRRDEHGWLITVELVEMRRIPDTSDMLATYEARFDEQGTLLTYQRTRRYLRGQAENGL
jgi:hypothetical protein